jgi:hypothetical protein
MLIGRDTCKSWQISREISSLKFFDNVLLLELSVNFQWILSTFNIVQWDKHSLYVKKPVLLKVRDICILCKDMINVRSCSVLHITFLWELSSAVKGILPISDHFLVAKTFTLWKISLISNCKRHTWVLEVKPGS